MTSHPLSTASRIDTHQHLVPPAWRQALDQAGLRMGGFLVPPWSPAEALALMDDHSIGTAILSVSTPGVHLGDDSEARVLAREVNDWTAELVKDRPDRFGFFASLPLPDVDAALDETAHALGELNADGVVLLANAGGRYLGDSAFEPLWAELDRRAAVVFIHPTTLPATPPVPGQLPALAEFLLDTTRTAISLVQSQTLRRHPHLRVILSHAGGFVPYVADRLTLILSGEAGGGEPTPPQTIRDDLSRFYFDTALSSSSALPSLLAFAHPDHILYGSDWPLCPAPAVTAFTSRLDTYFSGIDQTPLNRTNAEKLFPRLAPTPDRHPMHRSVIGTVKRSV